MSQVVGFLRRYQKYSENTVFEKWTSGIKSIRDVLQPKFDVMGVGDLAEIARQSRNFIESPKASSYFPSILLDSVMHQAIMGKYFLST